MVPRYPYRGWLFDLDGTVYLGEHLIPGADIAIATLRAAGRRVAFLSNKPLQTRAEYAAKLTRLGVPAAPDDVRSAGWAVRYGVTSVPRLSGLVASKSASKQMTAGRRSAVT